MGELAAAAAEEKVFWFFLYLFLEGGEGGVFGTAAAAGFYLALTHSLTLSFFPGRASLEECLKERKEKERRKRQYKVYFPPISFSASEGEKRREERREGHFEKSEEKVLVFLYLYIFMSYIYILFSCI